MSSIEFNAIAAMCNENRGIGKNNQVPWSIPKEFEYFQRVVGATRDKTKVNALITGRLNWEAMGSKPLDSNIYFIISSKMSLDELKNELNMAELEQTVVCRSLEEAIQKIKTDYKTIVETIYAIGGVEIYRSAIQSPTFKRFYLTRILESYECDVFLQPDNFLDNLTKQESKSNSESLIYFKYFLKFVFSLF
jgi:dihydrofolate reductase